jgi:nucleotide-binding universal stress UspA family protein
MYSQILIAVDGSELSEKALSQGLALGKALGSAVTVVTVMEPPAMIGGTYGAFGSVGYDPIPELIESQKKQSQEILTKAAAAATAAGTEVKTLLVENSFPAEGIIAAAEDVKAELIVMSSHGRRGFGRLLLGSQTSNVLAQSKIPVLVTR